MKNYECKKIHKKAQSENGEIRMAESSQKKEGKKEGNSDVLKSDKNQNFHSFWRDENP